MPVRNAEATWEGDLKGGDGSMALGSGAFEGAYSFGTRFEEEQGTNPEELIGAAHASCFSMALANELAGDGYDPERVHTTADVHLDTDSLAITSIELTTEATVPDIDEEAFLEYAEGAKENCPVSKALATEISLEATLTN
ncbi:MAG: OsmC family protein [Euryarchaeota archaeon]|jgi:osmotically inducible protein OsmC|nr:OsmC family protein [Euryarchaeota archaeon]